MLAIFRLSVYGLIALSAVGCGNSGLIKAKGHVVKGGQPFVAGDGEGLRIFFDPVNIPQGTTRYDSFAAEYHADDGTFEVQGKNGQGLPPGNYRISLQLMKHKEDLLKGSVMGKKSPFTCEVTGKEGDVVIDLDRVRIVDTQQPARKPNKTRRG
jgi:hypothetical protein